MRKLKLFFASFLPALLLACCLIGYRMHLPAAAAEGKRYYVGGMTAGFSLSAGGAEVIGLNEIETEDGVRRPAEEAGIRAGDCILAVDGIRTRTIADLNAALERSGGDEVLVTVLRGGEKTELPVRPGKERKSGKYKIGILIRDSFSGIGTVTYIEKETLRFGALGHAVCDQNRNPLEIADANVYLCSVIAVNKGSRGKAGELRGLFLNDRALGRADTVCTTGLYGTFFDAAPFTEAETMEIAPLSQATIGRAVIYSTIDGTRPQQYEIAIAKVDAGSRDKKNFVIKVTDERLITETGGIVQGMSGSPIVQNGKLIGAVTHVFLNDPTRGYGIGIENMLGN